MEFLSSGVGSNMYVIEEGSETWTTLKSRQDSERTGIRTWILKVQLNCLYIRLSPLQKVLF